MSAVYNPEADLIEEIERREHDARSIRRVIEHTYNQEDRRVLNRQLNELRDQIEFLRKRIP